MRTNPFKAKVTRNSSSKAEVEEVHELLQVYLTPEDIPEAKQMERTSVPVESGKMCLDKFVYYTLVMLAALFVLLFIVLLPYWAVVKMAKRKYQVSSGG